MSEDTSDLEATTIRPRDRDAIIQSLQAGLVPRRGLQHIQVGRAKEVKAVTEDLDRIADGGSAVRFVIGEYGSGKTFFLNLMRSIALEKRLVTAHADLTPDRRFRSTSGHGRALYQQLARNLSTRATPDGGALRSIVERFIAEANRDASSQDVPTEEVIRDRLDELSELVAGYAFTDIVTLYWEGYQENDDELQHAALRWLRGEYDTKTEARNVLDERVPIIDDSNWYEMTKLLARFVDLAGYEGLLINLDEMVNLYKLSHTGARKSNYEKLLSIVNDGLQGQTVGLGFLFAGTPDFLTDTKRGLYSYDALKTRLAESTFASDELVDMSGPVIRLSSLTQEDMFVLLQKLRHIHAGGDPENYVIPDEALEAFMQHCNEQIGAAYFQTPRNTIKEFLSFLAILEQNPAVSWDELIGEIEVESEGIDTSQTEESESTGDDKGDDLAGFKL
ncbi:ATP-binding protein [Halorubrum laminariae]|uniref:ATP-binding protein n=1 Tax=Halorubrum laminariae TaxID=1433523 RepID=A0ABD6BWE1_9EURY|nr:ATP-binding protein [Halorubrum laminariae]